MASLTISHVTKAFGDNVVLRDFDQVFGDGEFVTLLGPSGCGKTTMLRIIAGFEKPTSGELRIDDVLVSGGKTFVPPEKRGIGMVFQSYAVWPHMNVFDNVAYPLTIRRVSKEQIKSEVAGVLEMTHLSQYAQRMPSQLSGGQQQRVALARALMSAPKLLLLDEPLSNLDAKLRESMRFEIKELQKRTGITVVYVTHERPDHTDQRRRGAAVWQPGGDLQCPRQPVRGGFPGQGGFLQGRSPGWAYRPPGDEWPVHSL